MDAPGNWISIPYNLPVINYSENYNTQVPIQRYPTDAIVWLDEKLGVIEEKKSKNIIRQGNRRTGFS